MDEDDAKAVKEIKSRIHIPLVGDIHFDYRLALECAARGVDKIRINPGNIGDPSRVRAVADACRERKIHIRVGVNGGSLEREMLQKYGGVTAEALESGSFAPALEIIAEASDFMALDPASITGTEDAVQNAFLHRGSIGYFSMRILIRGEASTRAATESALRNEGYVSLQSVSD
jgi:hypothetical protein